MDEKTLNQLYLILFLDSFCSGITLPVLNNYIVVGLKGSHFILGLLSMVQIITQVCISPLLSPITKFAGPRNLLILSHLVTFINYVILVIANNYRLFLLFRLPFFIFNQSSFLIDVLISNIHNKSEGLHNAKIPRRLASVALIIGPFCGGIFYHDNSILCVACVLNILTILNLVLVYKLPQDTNLTAQIDYPRSMFSKLWQTNWRGYWKTRSVMSTMKILINVALACYFIKFTLILVPNLKASSGLIGFTISMHNVIFLSIQFGCQLIDDTMELSRAYVRPVMLSCLLLLSFSMYIMVTTRDYGVYLLAFVALGISREMYERFWNIQMDNSVKKSVESIGKGINCFLPVIYGIFCDLYPYRAVQTMAVVPLTLSALCGFMFMTRSAIKTRMTLVEEQIKKSFDTATNKKTK